MKPFPRLPSTTKIKPTEYFLTCGVSLYCGVVIEMKIKPGRNLTNEIFTNEKFPIYGILSLCLKYRRSELKATMNTDNQEHAYWPALNTFTHTAPFANMPLLGVKN